MSQPRVQRRTRRRPRATRRHRRQGAARNVARRAVRRRRSARGRVGSDGLLRTLRITDGGQIDPPVPFLPPNARPSSIVYVDGLVYTSTSNGCGNAPNGVWGIDLLSPEKKVAKWETGGANVAGAAGVTLGTSGMVYAATGAQPAETRTWLTAAGPAPTRYANSVVALDRITLEAKDWFTRDKADFNTTPVVFRYKGKDYLAVDRQRRPSLPARWRRRSAAAITRRRCSSPTRSRRPAPAPARHLAGRRRHALGAGARRAAASPRSRSIDKDGKLALEPAGSRATSPRRWRRWSSTASCSPRRAASIAATEPNMSAAERAKRSTPGGALRARRRDRQGAVVERHDDHLVRAGRAVGRRRAGLPRHLRQHALRLRHPDGALIMGHRFLPSAALRRVRARRRARCRERAGAAARRAGQGRSRRSCAARVIRPIAAPPCA